MSDSAFLEVVSYLIWTELLKSLFLQDKFKINLHYFVLFKEEIIGKLWLDWDLYPESIATTSLLNSFRLCLSIIEIADTVGGSALQSHLNKRMSSLFCYFW